MTMLICKVCGEPVNRSAFFTLNPLAVERRDEMVRPKVPANFAPAWMRIASVKPHAEGICAQCAEAAVEALGTDKLRLKENAPGSLRTFALFVPFESAEVKERRPQGAVGKTKVHEPAPVLKPVFRSVQDVAQAAADRALAKHLKYAGKRERPDDKRGYETQCVTAANAPSACEFWGDWRDLRVISTPEPEGKSARQHWGFCPACAKVLALVDVAVSEVSLFEAITGTRPYAQGKRVERVVLEPRDFGVVAKRGRRTGKTRHKRDKEAAARVKLREEQPPTTAGAPAPDKPSKA